MRTIIFAVPVLASIAALPAEAEMFGPGFQPCGNETSTLAVVECVQAKNNVADQRLMQPTRRCKPTSTPLNVNHCWRHKRLWVQYRDANCGFYGTRDGSIRQVQAAECIRSMTEDRAHELEKAMKLDSGEVGVRPD